MAGVEEGRVHPHAHPSVDPLGRPDHLQSQAELLGVLHVVRGQVLDALVDDLVEVHRGGEGQPGEDGHLGRRVAAGDVVGRVGLGVAELLRLAERLLVRQAGAAISVRM